MITAQVVARDGRFSLSIDGHAPHEVCAAVTAFEQTAVIWLEQLALLLPDHLHITIDDGEDPR